MNEEIMDDDTKVYGNYLYVADGIVYRSDWHDITIRQLKVREGFKEVRRCDMVGRGAFKREEEKTPLQRMLLTIDVLHKISLTKQEFSWPEFYKLCGSVKMSNEERKELAWRARGMGIEITYAKKVKIFHMSPL